MSRLEGVTISRLTNIYYYKAFVKALLRKG